MSTKTTFKRVALVTVAALGFGVLTSVAPAQANVATTLGVAVGPNVLIDQLITVDGTGTRYSANGINIGWIGNWNSVEIKSTDSSIDRLSNGQYLITATFNLGYLNESDFVIPTGSRGYDLADAPKSITTRILMNAGKTQVLAQAVQVKNK